MECGPQPLARNGGDRGVEASDVGLGKWEAGDQLRVGCWGCVASRQKGPAGKRETQFKSGGRLSQPKAWVASTDLWSAREPREARIFD